MERMVSRHGCQINGQDRRGKTALYCAAETNDVHSLKSLLRLDASPTVVDGNSFTPLYIAAVNGHLDCVKALLALGSEIVCIDMEDSAGEFFHET